MKFKWILIFLFLSVLINSACEENLDELNKNPNRPDQVSPKFLLSNIIWEAANENTKQAWLAGNMLSQYTSNLEFLPVDRYELGTNVDYWDHLYHLMNDIKSMNKMPGSNNAYKGVGMIMKAWIASQLTDMWYDVPYSEALKGENKQNFTPAYDKQKNIYTNKGGILDLLKRAVDILKNTNENISGDIMYNGNLNKWIRFANSLRIRYLLRISGKIDVSQKLQSIIDKDNIMHNNEDNAVVPYLSSAPNQWFIFNEREGRYTDVRMSSTIDSVMNNLEDDRVKVYFKPTQYSSDSLKKVYNGLPNGLNNKNQDKYDLKNISLLGSMFRDRPDGFDAVFMRYSELQFAIAEAAQKGLINGDPSPFYKKGIKASYRYFDVKLPDDYFLKPKVKLNNKNNLNKILIQKWIALFMNGHEAWFNIRRTGIPDLPIPKNNKNNDKYPKRYLYPESEQAVNNKNYKKAAERIGGDHLNNKGWWEK